MTTYLPSNDAQLWLVTPGFDDLLLLGSTIDDGGHEWTMKAQAENASWDNPVPIDVSVQRWMTDGAVASTQGHDNRSPTFQVIVSAGNAVDLAFGEAALAQRATQSCLLVWYPPSGPDVAPASVFEVWTWHLQHDFDPDRELRLSRMYTVAMTAKPWARSLGLTVSEAVPTGGTPTTTQIDACTSVTGWTGSPNTPTVTGGTAIRESKAESGGHFPRTVTRTLTRTGSVTGMDVTPYLALDVTASPSGGSWGGQVAVKVDGQACAQVGSAGTTSYWQVPAGATAFTTLTITATFTVPYALTCYLDVRDVSKTDKVGVVGSHKMLTRHLDTGGSVKTSGSIQIASPSATVLGNTLIYTCPDVGNGYSPSLRQFRTSGNATAADATCVSGFHEAFVTSGASAGNIDYSVPSGQLRPATYAVVARIVVGAQAKFTVSLSLNSTGSTQAGVTSTFTADGTAINLGGFWAVLGVVALPAIARPAESTADHRFILSATASTGTHSLDEVFLLDVTHGSFTLVPPMIFSPTFTHLWIDSPDADPVNNLPHIYCGSNADRSDALQVPAFMILSMGDHDLAPSGSTLFTVTDGVDDAVVTASYFHRWHTHAGD